MSPNKMIVKIDYNKRLTKCHLRIKIRLKDLALSSQKNPQHATKLTSLQSWICRKSTTFPQFQCLTTILKERNNIACKIMREDSEEPILHLAFDLLTMSMKSAIVDKIKTYNLLTLMMTRPSFAKWLMILYYNRD